MEEVSDSVNNSREEQTKGVGKLRVKRYPRESVQWRIRKIERENPGIGDYIGSSDCGCCDVNNWLYDGGDYMTFEDYEKWRFLLYGKRGT